MLIQVDDVVATRFVDLALKHDLQGDVREELPGDDIQVLLEMISNAGFVPKEIVPGELLGNYRDQDGVTGETFPINGYGRLKVINLEGRDHYFATGWLDCAFRRVVAGFRHKESREQLIEAIITEIKRSVPLQPIRLNFEGDMLCEYPPGTIAFGLEYFVDHTRDDRDLGSCVGIHMCCDSYMDRHGATYACDAIVCRGCYLRVLFPREIKTYRELREALRRIWMSVKA